MIRIVCVLIGYIFGLFETSYIYGKIRGIDIREHGSGNAGATNMLRTLGAKAGAITFLGDALKCLLASVLVRNIFADSYPEMTVLLGMYAAMGAVLGHNFPFYLNFKGGKGIAATGGLLASLDPLLTLIAILLFGGTVLLTKYVSLGSILVVLEMFIGIVLYGFLGKWNLSQAYLTEMYVIAFFLASMAIFRHRENIKRLLNGTERKIGERAK